MTVHNPDLVKSGGVKLVLWAQTATIIEITDVAFREWMCCIL